MKTSKKYKEKMKEIAQLYDLEFDGGDEETILFKPNNINVFAHLMKKSEYNKMLKAIDKTIIENKNYTVYAGNDSSSFSYWKERGESGESNYIMVCADIKSIEGLNIPQLLKDLKTIEDKLCIYDNTDDYHYNKEF